MTIKHPENEILLAEDVAKIFGVGINRVDQAVLDGVIPLPLGNPGWRQTRRWSRATVDAHLGKSPITKEVIVDLIREQLELFGVDLDKGGDQ